MTAAGAETRRAHTLQNLRRNAQPCDRPISACHALAAKDVAPLKRSNGEQGPDGDQFGQGLFHPHPFPLPLRERGGYETASKPYGSDGSIPEEFGVCQYILKPFTAEDAEIAENGGNGGKRRNDTAFNPGADG